MKHVNSFPSRTSQALSSVTAALLAGGLGTRLRSVVADQPKVLAKVRGRAFLSYLLEQLTTAGIKKVVLCTGYLGSQVQQEYGDFYGDLHLLYSQEAMPLGTGGALRLALPFFQSEHILVMNGDSFCTVDLEAFWNWYHSCGARAGMVLVKAADARRYGRVYALPDDQIQKFEEKSHEDGASWVNAGIYLMRSELVETIRSNAPVSLEHEVIPAWIGQGLYGYESDAHLLDIGTPESYLLADRFLPTQGH
jgi:D-glycero-alpha-D-manno-heptose 1-phosphate guanylyltransferase